MHQFRQAYDFDRGEFGQFSESAADRADRLAVERFDRVALGEARRIFTISGNVADRLKRYSGLDATVLPPPPQKLAYHTDGYDDFVLSVNRLDRYKRIDLLIEAAKADPALRIVIVGDGPDRGRLEGLASGLNGRIEFAGRVDGDRLADLYARCLAVYYAPVDEDYGMVPYEAFLSAKPVVTTVDAGGPLEVVHDGETGLVVEPDAAGVAARLRRARGRPDARPQSSARPGRRSPSGSPGTPASRPCSRESRLLLAAAALALGNRRLLDAAPAGAARAHRGGGRRAAGQAVAARRRRPLPRREQPRRPRLDRRRAPQAARCRRPARARPPSPDRRDHARPRRRPRLPRRDGARLRRRRAPDRPRRPRQPAAAHLGDPAGALPAHRHDPRPRRPASIVHSRYVEEGARARRLRAGRSGGSRTRSGRSGRSSPSRLQRRPADRLLRAPEHEQADPGAARGLRRAAEAAPGRPAAARRRRHRALRPRPAVERLGSAARG